MFRRFKYLFNKYPFVSNSIIYGTLYVTAECSQQIVTKKFLVGNDIFFVRIEKNNTQYRVFYFYAAADSNKCDRSFILWFIGTYLIAYTFSIMSRRNRRKIWIRRRSFAMASWAHFYIRRCFIHGQFSINFKSVFNQSVMRNIFLHTEKNSVKLSSSKSAESDLIDR